MRNGFELLRVLCIKDTNTCILSDMSQSVYISHKIHVKYVINVICIYSYLSRICVLKGKIKWIENYVRLEFALNTPLKCKIMIFKIRKNKKILEKFLESLFGIMTHRYLFLYYQ